MRSASIIAGVCLVASLCLSVDKDKAVIDDCRYADDAAAQAVWQPMKGSAPVSSATVEGQRVLRLACNFAGTDIERASWDRKVKLDLSSYQGVEFRFFAKNTLPVSHYNIYLQSGNGWYSSSFFPESLNGWNTIAIDKASMRSEGTPAGWGSIQTIRVSAWRARSENTEFYLGGIRSTGALGVDASVAMLRAEPGDAVAETLAALGIRAATLSDHEVTAERLHGAKLVILPNNPTLPDRAAAELAKYLHGGGKLLIFYGVPAQLRAAVKIETGKHIKPQQPGQFSSIRFLNGALPGAPLQVGQHSWNIFEARPVPGASKVIAEWLDDKGEPSGHAAIVASDNCMLMTHVLLKDDPVNKRRMLMAMAGMLAPDLWRQAAEKTAANADRLMLELAKAQTPLPGEFRAFWCHRATGVEGMEWDEAIRRLAENGFTAILPNMLWGGAAFYQSKVLPVADDVAQQGDQIAKCLAACKKYGVQMHVWKVNWNLGRSVPAAFVEKMRIEGRLQVSASGKEERWLCPSHPDNRKLEIASMVEVARDYDVDGIHFDYIRYPGKDHCFCAGCRARFAKAAGVKIERWPQDVTGDGPLRRQWLDWRRGNITAVVKAVSEQARAVKSRIKISAAVFRNWETDRDGVGQDWKLWCEKGWLDFVCPMDYSNSDRQFENWIVSQKQWAGRTPMYPGIGASSSSSRLSSERVIGQIRIARAHNTNGFVIFNYGVPEARDLLPVLGLGITAKR